MKSQQPAPTKSLANHPLLARQLESGGGQHRGASADDQLGEIRYVDEDQIEDRRACPRNAPGECAACEERRTSPLRHRRVRATRSRLHKTGTKATHGAPERRLLVGVKRRGWPV